MANDYIEMLKERDKAKAVKRYVPITEGIEPWAMCPNCGRLLLTDDIHFCDNCGQRVDMTVWELQERNGQNNA